MALSKVNVVRAVRHFDGKDPAQLTVTVEIFDTDVVEVIPAVYTYEEEWKDADGVIEVSVTKAEVSPEQTVEIPWITSFDVPEWVESDKVPDFVKAQCKSLYETWVKVRSTKIPEIEDIGVTEFTAAAVTAATLPVKPELEKP